MKSLPDLYKRCRLTERGYFAFPLTESDKDVPNYEEWRAFGTLLEEAKRGAFTRVPVLIDWVAQTKNWVLQGLYLRLLGDAGPTSALKDLLTRFPVGRNIVLEFGYGLAFEYWGHLSVIPVLADLYERYYFSQDSVYVAQGLSRLMEDVPGDVRAYPYEEGEEGKEAAVKKYAALVRERYEQLCAGLDSRDAVVFRGEVISVQHLCKKMIDDLGVRHGFHEEMRHKFEAVTGIDCSGFYSNGSLQPLAVAALVEQFLESPKALTYEKGVRYFFGHRVPD